MIARTRIYAPQIAGPGIVRGHVWKLFGMVPVWRRRWW